MRSTVNIGAKPCAAGVVVADGRREARAQDARVAGRARHQLVQHGADRGPRARASASACAIAAMLTPAQRLLQSFAACPRPWSPTCTTSVPSASKSGRARSAAAAAPPTMIVSVPASAPIVPPETGASSASMPRARERRGELARERRRRGRHVDAERAGREALGETAVAERRRRAPPSGEGSIVIATSAPARCRARARAGLDAVDGGGRDRGRSRAPRARPRRGAPTSGAPCGRARRMRRRSRPLSRSGRTGRPCRAVPAARGRARRRATPRRAISASRSTPVSTPRPSSR